MIIVFIRWKIVPNKDKVDDFLEYWRKIAVVQDRRGLIGEFLSEPHSTAEYDWITWDLGGDNENYRSFINVGVWDNPEEFREQIAKYFNDTAPPKDFEADRRVRTVLRPKCWRMGDSSLPIHDSGGVL